MNGDGFFQQLLNWLRSIFGAPQTPPQPPLPPATGSVEPVQRKVSLLILNPLMTSEGGSRLNALMGWNNPDALVSSFIEDLRTASRGYVDYQIVERNMADDIPALEDGFVYSSAGFMDCWRSRSGFHQPGWVDYNALLYRFGLVEKVNQGLVDEVWVMGFPYAGFYESRMAGPGAFWCNAPALVTQVTAQRRFVVMGFSYERGVGEMLESYAHRVESIMSHAFNGRSGDANLWERFTRYEQLYPGKAEVGTVHYAPNSSTDYEWGSPVSVLSRCDAWLNYPDLSAPPRRVDCREWGSGDIRAHHLWWLEHLPHVGGVYEGISNNWWEYVVDPNLLP